MCRIRIEAILKQNYCDEISAKRDFYFKGPIIIEDNIWIGDNVVMQGE